MVLLVFTISEYCMNSLWLMKSLTSFWRFALTILCEEHIKSDWNHVVVFRLFVCSTPKRTRFCAIFGYTIQKHTFRINLSLSFCFVTLCWFAKPIVFMAKEFQSMRIDVSCKYSRMNAEKANRFPLVPAN